MIAGQNSKKPLMILGGLSVLGILLLYGVLPYTFGHRMQITSVFGALWTMWDFFPDFQHGMIVPFLAAFVVYRERRKLAKIPVNGWAPGIVLVALVLALFWAGRRVDNQYIGFFSLQALLAALVLWLLGWRWLSALAFPLAFLIFTWPMPFMDNIITFPLRMFMSGMSVGTLNFFGLSVVQNGTGILSAPNPEIGLATGKLFQVDVADPCSGIRSLFALMMISALCGYFMLKSPWHRAILFLASIPLAILGNLVRILMLTLGIVTVGSPLAIGSMSEPSWFHEGAGYVVFLVALSGIIFIVNLLNFSPSQWRQKWRSAKAEIKNSTQPSVSAPSQSDLY